MTGSPGAPGPDPVLRDTEEHWPVVGEPRRCRGVLLRLRTDQVRMPDGRLVEFVEMARDVHPYLVATQAHPEFMSRPTRPHPLFRGLVAAALEHSRSARSAGPASVRPAAASA